MSRISKWKPEKTKTKVVFRLQFHATHIPQTGWDKLFISFIPADSGKATAKTSKANVRNGTCKWADPIYETTRLLQDIRTRQYDEKLYKLVVAMGSSRSSVLGEATINLSDYADALKPSSVALSLRGCDTGAILHVTIQLLTSKTGFREFEQQRELRERGLLTTSDQNGRSESVSGRMSSSEDFVSEHTDYARVRFKHESREHTSNEEEMVLNEERVDSPIGLDGSSNTSGSLYAEKHDTSSAHEIDSIKSTVSGDLGGLSLSQSPRPGKTDPSDQRHVGTSDWVHVWGSDYSADNDLATTYDENNRLRGSLEAAESSLHELKSEVSSLQGHADNLGAEAQKFAQQLAGEMASGENLAREVAVLKSECSKFKAQIEMLKIDKLSSPYVGRDTVGLDQDQDLKLRCFRGLLLMEDKIRELQNKTCFGLHDRDFRFLGSDLEALLVMLQDLKQGTGQAVSRISFAPPEGGALKQIGDSSINESKKLVSQIEFGTDLYQPESMLHHLSVSGLSHDPSPADVTDPMKDRIVELLRELDESKAERESLTRKMDQMECYYEALVQELEGNQRHMLGELQNLRNEHTACLYAVSTANKEMDRMRQEMNEQLLRFAEEKRELDLLNKELERRAATAEAALKRARLNYSIAVNQLQKDLELLSGQVSSMYEANENLIKKAFEDSTPQSFQGVTAHLQNQKLDPGDVHATKLLQCHNMYKVQKKQVHGDILLDDLRRSLHLQEELYQKVKEDMCDANFEIILLDVFSKTLRETLHEASSDITVTKNRVDKLTRQLELATESKDVLTRKLESTMKEVRSLSDCKEAFSLKYNEMTVQNQMLESNLRTITSVNHSLEQKIKELESLMTEYGSYRDKFETSDAERIELADQLRKEVEDSAILRSEKATLQGELQTLEQKMEEVASAKEYLQNIVHNLQDKLHGMLMCHNENFDEEFLLRESDHQDTESGCLNSIVTKLSDIQQSARDKYIQAMEERKALEKERNVAVASLSTSESDIFSVKEKFGHDLRVMLDKLSMSTSLVQKLQIKVEALANRLGSSSEAEERHEQQQKEALADLCRLELELEQLVSRNEVLSQKFLALESISEELGQSKLIISECTKENHALMASLQSKTETSSQLELVVSELRENLHSQEKELHNQRSYIEKLEISISDLTSELNGKHCQLLSLDEQRVELLHLRQLISNLELENSRIGDLLLHSEEFLKVSREESSSVAELENQLFEMHEFLISADIQLIFTRVQYETGIQDFVWQLQFSDRYLEMLQQKNLDLESRLRCCLENEAHHFEESTKLLTRLESLRSDLEASIAQNSELHDVNNVLMAELEEHRQRNETLDASICAERRKHAESLESLKFDLDASIAQNRLLHDSHNVLKAEIEEHRQRSESWEASICKERREHADSIESLRSNLEACISENRVLCDTNGILKAELEEHRNINAMLDAGICEERRKHAEILESLKSDLAASIAQNRVLEGTNNAQKAELEEHRKRNEMWDATISEERRKHDDSIESLRSDLEALVAQNRNLQETNNALMAELEEQKKRFDMWDVSICEERSKHTENLRCLNSNLEDFIAQNRKLHDANNELMAELEEYRKRNQNWDASVCEERGKHASEAEMLKSLLMLSEEEIDGLMLVNEELQVKLLVLEGKIKEQSSQLTLLEQCQNEIVAMQKQCKELTEKLSEQVMKTEEYKSLASHLRQLKDEADAEVLQAREKKETDGQTFAVHESLRIAFIKEQYETKLQELKQQLSMSKKHSEEMLWKLQDAVDEVESRKKSEASNLKKNEELGMRILELESELQAVVSEKREKSMAFDCMKAEMECSLISLECCKEEKQKLEASLLECNEEKTNIAAELALAKEFLESSKTPRRILEKDADQSQMDCMPDDLVAGTLHSAKSLNRDEADACTNLGHEDVHASGLMNMQSKQDLLTPKGENGVQTPVDRDIALHSDRKDLDLLHDQFKVQVLKSSMDNLSKELEKMKNENWLLSQDDHVADPKFPELQRELMRLDKANEELSSKFPLFNEMSGGGNALERVLALEIELAEALQAKKKSTIQFQSSFLRQHGDEEAILKSFRDINELIKDMLELKGKYASVEGELKEMHDRYSQLSLQFAEVEGERQKLMMTLKCVRSSRKAANLNRSSSASIGDHSS
ncbi:repetitive organellar protein [Rhodamnia argentea]|uniref:Repetitive organellar protein n=1 Tax=Rhodamnia argentea TaxID=178133 RepID=A0A8B8Q364_9MYRT|nr:repetitive organellar protein [Rhodamnia argentea]